MHIKVRSTGPVGASMEGLNALRVSYELAAQLRSWASEVATGEALCCLR
jgi:hypothetical protein